jgi:two-component system LytT family response regulator
MKKAIIIEDNPKGIQNLKNLIKVVSPDLKVIATAKSIKEGVRLLSRADIEPDVAFLDIKLEDGLVFHLLNQLEEVNFEIIFVTAYDNYMKKACEFSSIGYINKPIDPDELKEAINRIRPYRRLWTGKRLEIFKSHYEGHPNPYQQIIISATDGHHLFQISEIRYLEGDDNCTWFHLRDKRRFLVTKNIQVFEHMLHQFNFHRIHRSHVVNLNDVVFCSRGESGYVRLRGVKETLSIAKARKPLFIMRLKQLHEDYLSK